MATTEQLLLSRAKERNDDLEEMIYNMMNEIKDPDDPWIIGRYMINIDGTVHDSIQCDGKEIPQWVIDLGDLILNYISR